MSNRFPPQKYFGGSSWTGHPTVKRSRGGDSNDDGSNEVDDSGKEYDNSSGRGNVRQVVEVASIMMAGKNKVDDNGD